MLYVLVHALEVLEAQRKERPSSTPALHHPCPAPPLPCTTPGPPPQVNTNSLFGGRTYDADGKLQTAAAINLVYYMEGGDEGTSSPNPNAYPNPNPNPNSNPNPNQGTRPARYTSPTVHGRSRRAATSLVHRTCTLCTHSTRAAHARHTHGTPNAGGLPDRLTLPLTLAQVDYLVGPEWTDDPPLSEGSATNGTVTWESDVVSVYPTALTLTPTLTL